MNEQLKYEENNDVEIDLKSVILAIKNGKKWLIIIPAIMLLLSLFYVFIIADPVYTSETKILLSGGNDNNSQLSSLAGQFGLSLPFFEYGKEFLSIESLPEILESRKLAKTLLNSNFKSDLNINPQKLIDILISYNLVDNSDSNSTMPKAIKYFTEKMIKVKNIRNTSIFSLSVNSPSPILSSDLSLVIIDELSNQELSFQKIELGDQLDFISGRIIEVQSELYKAESKLKNFREENLQINLSPTLLLEQERLEREIEVQTQIFISLKQQLEQIKIEEAKNSSILKIIDPPDIPIKPSKPNKLLIIIGTLFFGVLIGTTIALSKYYSKLDIL